MYLAGWIAIGIQIILLLVWIYRVFIQASGTDAAGSGIAIGMMLGGIVYIAIGFLLMRLQRPWASIAVIAMTVLPLWMLVSMFVKDRNSSPTPYESSDPDWKAGTNG